MSAAENASADVLSQDAQLRLKDIIQQIEASNARKAEEAAHCKAIYDEAGSAGYDVKILRKAVREKAKDRVRREQDDAILSTYLVAVGAA